MMMTQLTRHHDLLTLCYVMLSSRMHTKTDKLLHVSCGCNQVFIVSAPVMYNVLIWP